MKIKVRSAGQQDYPAVHALIQEFARFQKTPEKVSITPGEMADNQTIFNCLVAERENGELIGFASYFYAYYSWSGKALYLDDLYVKESHRNLGAGKMLLNTVIDIAIAEKCKKVRWQVSGWNTEAIGFYKSIGATIDDTELNCDLLLDGK